MQLAAPSSWSSQTKHRWFLYWKPRDGRLGCLPIHHTCRVLGFFSGGLGIDTNYNAEVAAVIHGLENAIEQGWLQVWVECDSICISGTSTQVTQQRQIALDFKEKMDCSERQICMALWLKSILELSVVQSLAEN
ncbi:hypothetical protein FRX31_007646 [Thalictrum thalictroides]|uniref:RNase H type-1 domain-containing protein n=1 Tax=Thalictrum thalictroides TaxID=46969 RepID=A0A7J6X130_THATH|nr:hypothetical protein FRX31_007646 [Thalictrum thalictroides]